MTNVKTEYVTFYVDDYKPYYITVKSEHENAFADACAAFQNIKTHVARVYKDAIKISKRSPGKSWEPIVGCESDGKIWAWRKLA